MEWLKDLITSTPLLALFICIALGYLIGGIKFGPIKFGGVAGTLIVALLIGQTGVTIDDTTKTLAFALFIFALGYMGGPAFFSSLNKKSVSFAVLTVIEVVSVVGLVVVAIVLLDLDPGTAGGLYAGAATESAAVGTTTEAISALGIDEKTASTWEANVATAYSVSYLFGLVTIVLFTSQIAPLIMHMNLRDEAAKLWKKLGGDNNSEDSSPALPTLVGRVYRVDVAAGLSVQSVENALAGATVERIGTHGTYTDPTPETTLVAGDTLLLVGPRRVVIHAEEVVGEEIPPSDDMNIPLDTKEFVFTAKGRNDEKLGALRSSVRRETRHGVYLQKLERTQKPLPALDNTVVKHGDVLTITGAPKDVQRVGGVIGKPVQAIQADFIYLSLGLIVGILIGKLAVHVGGVDLTLGVGGGALLAGLFFGWLRAKHPTFGAFQPAAAGVIKDLGLATFIAATGLGAGKAAIELIKQYGVALPIAGVLMVLVPASISLIVGWKVLKLPQPVLLGGIAGQQCSTPAVGAVQSAAGNTTPLLGYTITYAISNIALPIMGPVVIAIAYHLQ